MDKIKEAEQTELLNILKSLEIKDFEKIRLDKVLYNISGESVKSNVKKAVKSALKRCLFNSYVYNIKVSSKKIILFSYDYKRSDHRNSWNQIKKLINSYDELCITDRKFDIHNVLKLDEIINSIILLKKYYKELVAVKSKKDKLFLASYLVEAERFKKDIEKLNLKNEVSIMYFDGGFYENLFTQIMRKNRKITITMQHGQPVFHGLDTDRINQTMILNFSSDYIIVPGEFSKKQFLKGGVFKDSIKVLGTLKEIKPYERKNNQCFSVILDCPTNINAININNYIIQIAEKLAKKLNVKYYIKVHPSDSISHYEINKYLHAMEWRGCIDDCIEQTDYSIIHFTGAYVDALAKHHKCFVLYQNEQYPFCDNESEIFFNYEDLYIKVCDWKGQTDDCQENYLDEKIDYYLSPKDAKRRHKKFIFGLIGEK